MMNDSLLNKNIDAAKLQLLDFVDDFDKLCEDDKKYLITSIYRFYGYKLINLYNYIGICLDL